MRRGGVFSRRAASMVEAVRGRVRPELPSMRSDALYSGMNAGRWRRARTRAGEGGGVLVGQGGQKRAWDRSGLPQTFYTFVSGLREKSRPDRRADAGRRWMSHAVRTARSERMRAVCGSALEMP